MGQWDTRRVKLDDLPTQPQTAELVETDTRDSPGADLLGLRVPAEAVAVHLHNGVTTVTPSIRHLSLRAWCINRYLARQGPNDRKTFLAFAGKVEAAIAYGSVLTGVGGVVGRNAAAHLLNRSDGDLPLRPLVKSLAASLYTGPANALGLGTPQKAVPTLTPERGLPIAAAFDKLVGSDEILCSISATGDEETASRDSLVALGQKLRMSRPEGQERQLLLGALLPATPRENELQRIATYCLLLLLAGELHRPPTDKDLFETASSASLDAVPTELHEACDGWTRFLVRDLLVFVHEAATAQVVQQLYAAGTPDHRRAARATVAELVAADLDEGFAAISLTGLSCDQPISRLVDAVTEAVGPAAEIRGLRRWTGRLNELALLLRSDLVYRAEGLGVLPVAWLLAAYRIGLGVASRLPGFDIEGAAGSSRMGMTAVVLPEIRTWRANGRSIRETTEWLIRRSVDQHLRIAWSRLAREPHKDVSVLQSDGEDWIYLKDLSPGRATSRLDRAVGWLRQLGLIDDTGLTGEGATVLSDRLAVLHARREAHR